MHTNVGNIDETLFPRATPRGSGIYWPSATIILVNCTLGAGLLALPFAFAEVGSVPIAIGIQLLVCVPVALSVVILGYCAAFYTSTRRTLSSCSTHVNRASHDADERTPLICASIQAPSQLQRAQTIETSEDPTYEKVCGRIGAPASFAASLAVALYTFTSCVALLVIIGDNLDKLFLCAYGDRFCESWYLNRQFTIPASALVFILPMCFARRMDFLKIPSAIGVLGLFYVVALVVLKYYLTDAPTNVCRNAASPIRHNASLDSASSFAALIIQSLQKFTENISATNTTQASCVCTSSATHAAHGAAPLVTALHSVCVFCLAFQSHVNAVPVFACLARPAVGEWARAVFTSYFLCSLVYACVGAFGYEKFGDRVQSDILNNYAPDAFVLVAIGLLALKLCVTYPTSSLVGSQTLLDFVDQLRDGLRRGNAPPTTAFASHDEQQRTSASDANSSINGDGGGGGGENGPLARPYSNEIIFEQHASVYSPIGNSDGDAPESGAGPGAGGGPARPVRTASSGSVDSALARIPCALLWFALSLLPAVLVRSLGQVLGVLGSLAALLMFFFPGLALLGVARDLRALKLRLRAPEHLPPRRHADSEVRPAAAAADASASSAAAPQLQPQPQLQAECAGPIAPLEQPPPSPSYTPSTLVAHGSGSAIGTGAGTGCGDPWHQAFFGHTNPQMDTKAADTQTQTGPSASASRRARGERGRHYTPPPLEASSPALLHESHSEFATTTASDAATSEKHLRVMACLLTGAFLYIALGVLLFVYMLAQSIFDLITAPASAC